MSGNLWLSSDGNIVTEEHRAARLWCLLATEADGATEEQRLVVATERARPVWDAWFIVQDRQREMARLDRRPESKAAKALLRQKMRARREEEKNAARLRGEARRAMAAIRQEAQHTRDKERFKRLNDEYERECAEDRARRAYDLAQCRRAVGYAPFSAERRTIATRNARPRDLRPALDIRRVKELRFDHSER